METIIIILRILAYIFGAGLFLLFCWFILWYNKDKKFRRNVKKGIPCIYYWGETKCYGHIKEIKKNSVVVSNYFEGDIIIPISEIYSI